MKLRGDKRKRKDDEGQNHNKKKTREETPVKEVKKKKGENVIPTNAGKNKAVKPSPEKAPLKEKLGKTSLMNAAVKEKKGKASPAKAGKIVKKKCVKPKPAKNLPNSSPAKEEPTKAVKDSTPKEAKKKESVKLKKDKGKKEEPTKVVKASLMKGVKKKEFVKLKKGKGNEEPMAFKKNVMYNYYISEAFYGRVNINYRMQFIRDIENNITPADWQRILDGPFGNIMRMFQQVSFSSQMLHAVLFKQLKTKKKWGSWYEVGGKESRFSIHEFSIITGLNCGELPDIEQERQFFIHNVSIYVRDNSPIAKSSDSLWFWKPRRNLAG